MSVQLTRTGTFRLAKLMDECLAAGIGIVVMEGNATTVALTLAEGSTAAQVDTVIAAHDSTTPSATEQKALADDQALTAFRLGWVLGQARLQGTAAGSIQSQMDAIQALTNAQALTGANIKMLSEAVEDIARQLFTLKRTVAIQADVPDR